MKKKQKTKIKFNLFDYFWFAVGIVISIIAPFIDHEHTPLYIVLDIIALNSAILAEIISAKGRRSCFFFAILGAIVYGIVAWMNGYYGGAVINIFFFAPIGLVGFYQWGKNSNKKKEVAARKLNLTQIIILVAAVAVSSVGLKFTLEHFGGSSTLLDSISTVLVPIASVLGVLRYREMWVIWFISDTLILIMWSGSTDLPIIVQRIYYPIVAIYGFISWKKLLRKPGYPRHLVKNSKK